MGGKKDRREGKRVRLSVDVRFLLRNEIESSGVLLDISELGLALLTEADANEGDEIIAYPDGLGRLAGKVARKFDGGIGVAFNLSQQQRRSMKDRIAALIGGSPYMRLTEDRRSLRVRVGIETEAFINDDRTPVACRLVEISKTGCLLKCAAKPVVGSKIMVGALRGRVCRLEADGFAVDFDRIDPRAASYRKCVEQAA